MMGDLLDTNIVSFLIKRNLQIYQRIEDLKAQRKSIFISCVTYFDAMVKGLIVVSNDSDLSRVEGLSLENW